MYSSESQSDLVLELAEEFLERYRKGERPQLKEYIDRHPELAAEIREVFPAMAMMENIGVADESIEEAGPSKVSRPSEVFLKQLGDFRIIRVIGHGGMGVVYEAEQVSLGRHVALKVLPNQAMKDAKQKRRFEREARATAKLHHTNIVPVFGVGEHDGVPYYVMQFIQGLGLDSVLDELNKMQPGAAPKSTGMPTAGGIRVSRRDVTAANVARTLMIGTFEQLAEGDDVGDPDDPKPLGPSDPTLDGPADDGPHESDPSLSKSGSGRLSDTFTVSSTSIKLPGNSSGSRNKSAVRKQTYWQSVANIGRQVAEALDYAHKQGILHRDVKPSNLLLDLRGTVWVTDFGLAKVAGPDVENITHTGDILGTLRYMPPEAFDGNSDARGDVYSLGLTLYELLAMRPAFDEKDRHKLIKQVTTGEPTPLDKVRREIPRDLVTIVQKSIAREPARRYATAEELAADLQRFLDDEPILARRQTPVERYVRWARHNPGIAALSGVLAVVLMIVTVASLIVAGYFNRLRWNEAQSAQSERIARFEAERARQAEKSQRQLVEKERQRAEITLADSYTAAGIQASELNKSAESLIWFAEASRRSADDPARKRDNTVRFWSWARNQPIPVRALNLGNHRRTAMTFHADGRFALIKNPAGEFSLWNLTNERTDVFPDGSASVSVAAWNRDGTRLATFTRGGRVGIWRFPHGERLAEFDYPGVVSALAFDESGKWLAVASNVLRVWDCEGGKFITPEYAHPGNVAEIVFSQGGKMVATTCADNMCRVWPVLGDDKRKSPSFPPVPHLLDSGDSWGGYPSAPLFLNGDRALITRSKNAKAVWIDTTNGATVRTIGNNYLGWMVASPNRAHFAVASFSIVQFYDSANGNPVGAAMNHANYAFTGSFHPDGKSLLTVSADRTARLWSVPDGKPLASSIQHQDEVVAGVFLPRGAFFATAQKDGLLRIWKHESLVRLMPTTGREGYCQIAPDSRHAIAAGFNGVRSLNSSRVFDLVTGQPAGPMLEVGGGLINNAAFAPEGKRVVLLASLPENGKQIGPGLKMREQTGRVHFFDWSDGKRFIEPLTTPSEPVGAAFAPDGKRLVVVCANGEILILDASTGKSLRQLNHGAHYRPAFFVRDCVRFFPDGSRFVTWGLGSEARVWDAESGQLAYAIAHPHAADSSFVFDARFSPDGKLLATASWNKTVTIVDAATGKEVAPPLHHSDWVFTLRFSPDGKHIATACRDRMARIWDWQTGKLACPTLAHDNEVFDVSYACDGRLVLTAGKDGTTRIWDAALGKPMSPPLVMRNMCFRVAVTPDDAHVVIAGAMPNLVVYRLADLVEPGASPNGGLLELAEVISGLSLHPGGGIANLNTSEWLERWTSFRERNPDYAPLAYSP
jgi:eukaryotic-like serine/threonine-protein kinase